MKIEKAVDKFRRQWSKFEKEQQSQLKEKQITGSHPAAEWQAPRYSQSRKVVLDDAVVRQNRCVCICDDAPEIEHYKVLRTQIIQRAKPNGWNRIMITSLRPGEGKTVTSINLALAFAKTYNFTVLLMDCDLRQQKIFRYLNLQSEKGLADYLIDGTDLKDIIVWPDIEQLTLISGGPIIHESAELLGSPRMKTLLEQMKNRYPDRFILLDAPPILAGADALTLMPLVDGIVIVVESGKTALKEIEEGLALLPKEKILGFLMNKHTPENRNHYMYYGIPDKHRA